MARITAANAKIAAATAAADLTTILQDDTLTELFNDYKENHHPMRGIEKLFLLDAATGAVTSNDAYIDAAYAGDFPTSGINSGRQSQGPPTPLAVVSADIEIAAPADIVIVFSANIFFNPATAMTIAGAAAAGKTILSVAIAAATMTITVSADFIAADVVTVSGRVFGNRNNYVDLALQAVTNNIV